MITHNYYTLAQKVAQLIMPRLDLNLFYENASYKDSIYKLCEKDIGGFCLFNGNTQKVLATVNDLQSRVNIPLIFSADFENGLRMRLENGTEFPHAFALGYSNDYSAIAQIAKAIAMEARSIGVYWNLAPVCDINSNPKNPVINIRSFGENSNIVSNAIVNFIKSMQSVNVAACAKHFPGHGDTDIDSHLEMPIINKNLEQLLQLELIPFINAINSDVKSIMVGHILLPLIDKFPASLSKILISDILREKFNFNGIIISDAFDMASITQHYDFPDYLIKSKQAGIDIILLPQLPEEVIKIFIAKAEKDNDFEKSIEESFIRLMDLKNWVNKTKILDNEISFAENEKLALQVAYKSIRTEGDEELIPLDENKRIAVFAYIEDDLDKAVTFFRFLSQAFQGECDFAFIDENFSQQNAESYAEFLDMSDLFIFIFFVRGKAFKKEIRVNPEVIKWINNLMKVKSVVTIFLGSPYIAENITSTLKIYTYSDSHPSIAASVMLLCGRNL